MSPSNSCMKSALSSKERGRPDPTAADASNDKLPSPGKQMKNISQVDKNFLTKTASVKIIVRH